MGGQLHTSVHGHVVVEFTWKWILFKFRLEEVDTRCTRRWTCEPTCARTCCWRRTGTHTSQRTGNPHLRTNSMAPVVVVVQSAVRHVKTFSWWCSDSRCFTGALKDTSSCTWVHTRRVGPFE